MAAVKKNQAAIAEDEQPRFWRRGVDANAAFHEAMIAAGHKPETKTEPQGTTPMPMAPGLMGPAIRSNADF